MRLTLDALVNEAYRKAIDAGVAITNPDRWREWKRGVYVQTAKREGPGYLRRHHQRLGLGSAYPEQKRCAKCAHPVHGNPVQRDGDPATYCSFKCAGLRAVTLTEWLENYATPEQREGMERMMRRTNRKEATA